MSHSNLAPELELAALWNNEGDDIKIHIGAPLYGQPGFVYLWLLADTTNRYDIERPAGVDEVTLAWSFVGDSLTEVVADALEFAQALAALKPEDDDE